MHLFTSPDVDIKYVGGASPEMVLLDREYNEVKVGFFHYCHLC